MPGASEVVKNLSCIKCGKPLVRDGKVMCPRHKKEVELPVSLPQGKWFCPECLAHGFKKPRTLAINGQIKCRWCNEDKNSLIQKEETMPTEYLRQIDAKIQELDKKKESLELEKKEGLDLVTVEFERAMGVRLEEIISELNAEIQKLDKEKESLQKIRDLFDLQKMGKALGIRFEEMGDINDKKDLYGYYFRASIQTRKKEDLITEITIHPHHQIVNAEIQVVSPKIKAQITLIRFPFSEIYVQINEPRVVSFRNNEGMVNITPDGGIFYQHQ